ncbi:MAG TPA: beta-hydroxyacyl-ACP dehydratase, partial [Gallionellaceae bacterium]|nr:beta-hydroxyacyl-ACP dehydratase [Gallionellaceae bacterium]
MAALPIFGHRDPAAVFAYRQGRPVTAAAFAREVRELAVRLPDRPYILNLCSDRYRFAVGFAAALVRGQISLLPPNYTADFVARLGTSYPGFYCLGDGAANFPGVDVYLFSELMQDAGNSRVAPDAAEVPTVPAGQCAALVFTSGSTGDPVPHRKSWGGLVADGLEEAVQLGITPQSGLAVLGTV